VKRRAGAAKNEVDPSAESRSVSSDLVGDRLLSVAETAGILGTAEYFVRGIVKDGEIPYVRIGRLVKIRSSALGAYIDGNTIPARSNS
jgi:excisionase family DNA binding protein